MALMRETTFDSDWRDSQHQFLQANLTEALGILSDEILLDAVKPLLSGEELKTLADTSALLELLKVRLAYTHKIEAQVEKAWRRVNTEHELERVSIIDKLLPLEVKPRNYIDIVEWYVSMATHFPVHISKKPYYDIDSFESGLVSLHKGNREKSLKALLQDCRSMVHEALRECLWDSQGPPCEADLLAVIRLHEDRWRKRLCFQGRLMVDAVKAELATINTGVRSASH